MNILHEIVNFSPEFTVNALQTWLGLYGPLLCITAVALPMLLINVIGHSAQSISDLCNKISGRRFRQGTSLGVLILLMIVSLIVLIQIPGTIIYVTSNYKELSTAPMHHPNPLIAFTILATIFTAIGFVLHKNENSPEIEKSEASEQENGTINHDRHHKSMLTLARAAVTELERNSTRRSDIVVAVSGLKAAAAAGEHILNAPDNEGDTEENTLVATNQA